MRFRLNWGATECDRSSGWERRDLGTQASVPSSSCGMSLTAAGLGVRILTLGRLPAEVVDAPDRPGCSSIQRQSILRSWRLVGRDAATTKWQADSGWSRRFE